MSKSEIIIQKREMEFIEQRKFIPQEISKVFIIVPPPFLIQNGTKIIQKAARGIKLTKGEQSWYQRQKNLKQ